MSDATPQPGTPQPGTPQPGTPLSESDDTLYASLAHFLNIILLLPALILYLVFGSRGPKTAVEGKEALNWTINVTGLLVVAWIVNALLQWIPILGLLISILITLATWALIIVNIVFAIMGGVRVQSGGGWRYPVNIRWIK
ncbi:MAG: DUF4870 domain-containing protein [Microbacteriaceae bacterium]